MRKINKIITISVFLLAFVLTTSLVFAKKDETKGDSNRNNKASKSKDLKDFERPTKEKTNAQIHKDKTDEVADNLKNVGKEKELQEDGVEEISEEEIDEEIVDEVEEIAEDIAEASEDTVEAIEAVEKENKFKKFLVGTDYKNLGQLRSSLAHNENQIRKLTRLSEKVQTQEMEQNMEENSEIQNQLVILMQERERIKTVLQEGQEGFSILGWFGKLFGTKTEVEIDEENENQIEEEVLEALDENVNEISPEDSASEGVEELLNENN